MGVTMRSTVRKAARLAVYEEIRIRVKNHHTLPTMRPDIDLKMVIHHKMGFDIHNSQKTTMWLYVLLSAQKTLVFSHLLKCVIL